MPKAKKYLSTLIVPAIVILGAGGASAMTSTSTASNNQVAPYSGGASISKVFYPADGSTVTITSTGAVIKQSPGHSAYREGWVSTCNIAGINSEADLSGKLASGSSNPYSGNCQTSTSSSSTPAPAAPTAIANSTANATATANVTLAANTPSSQSSNTSSTSSQQSSSSTTKTIPNTGPGNVVAIGGITTVLGTVGHFFYQRLRYRQIAS